MMPPKSDKNASPRSSKVSFCKKKFLKKIPHLDTYTDEDHDRIWWSEEDSNDFRERAFAVAFGFLTTDDGESTRGLEKLTGEGRKRRIERRQRLIQGVLEEQRRMQESETKDEGIDDLLAEISSKFSNDCQKLAERLAYKDELEARECKDELEPEITTKPPIERQNLDIRPAWQEKLTYPKPILTKKLHPRPTGSLVAELALKFEMLWL